MPRPANVSKMSISQLQRLIDDRRSKLGALQRDRRKLASKLASLDAQIVSLGGTSAGAGSGSRARNAKSLVATMEHVLTRAGKPMSVGDIVDAVQKTGYRSTAANFRALVNQTLIKEKGFTAADRGVYTLKK